MRKFPHLELLIYLVVKILNFLPMVELNGIVRAVGKKEMLKTRTVKLFLDFDNKKNKLNRNLIIDENVNILIPISSNQSF